MEPKSKGIGIAKIMRGYGPQYTESFWALCPRQFTGLKVY